MNDPVLTYFYEISKIPRPSGKEEKIADYLLAFAKDRNLWATRDRANNVLIRKPASPGCENPPAVLLQGHTDMVCEKNAGTVHNFDTDGIRIMEDGDFLKADGTTLGADNGYAVAVMLSVLADDSIVHPALECLFTTGEEVGLDGMQAFDKSILTARQMINLDSCDETVATAACAGGVRTDFTRSPKAETAKGTLVRLSVTGLMGGHSGEDIHSGRANALKLCARLYASAEKGNRLSMVSMDGGNKDNAIPRECTVVFLTDDPEKTLSAIRAEEKNIRTTLSSADAGFTVTLTTQDTEGETVALLSPADSTALLALLRLLPCGPLKMSYAVPGLVETSSNTAIVCGDVSGITVTVSSRSSVESELDDVCDVLDTAAEACGFSARHYARYPGWDFTVDSPLQKVYLDTYRTLFGTEAKIIGIHAGLECGILKRAVHDMDMISIGPNMYDIHTPDERLSVSSAKKVYRLVLSVLEALSH